MFNPSDIDARFEDLQTKRAEDCFYESFSLIACLLYTSDAADE